MQTILVINEQHTLFPEQIALLTGRKIIQKTIPATGLILSEMKEWAEGLSKHVQKGGQVEIIFASPVPAMMKFVSDFGILWKTFHSDKRIKKELPGGKIIQVVADTGWQLV